MYVFKSLMKRYFIEFSILLVMIAAIWSDFNTNIWKDQNRVIQWDVIDYYGYLPAAFIYHDVSLKFKENYKGKKKFVFWAKKLPNGKYAFKYTMGLSIMYSPFFFAANNLASPLGYNSGGYSPPYRLAIVLAALFYLALGLMFLSLVLRQYFSKVVIGLVILTLGLGTNLFWYSTFEPGMPHVYDFALAAIFLFLTIKWYSGSTFFKSVFIGMVMGLLTLIRPVNFLFILFFLLFDVKSFTDLKLRFLFLIKRWRLIIVMIFFGFLMMIPQLWYWKIITGHWIYYSYGNEGFFFLHPQFMNVLLSFRKGWLIYTPVMFFSLIGIILLYYKNKKFFWPVLVLFVAYLYVVSSWWSWWYGGSLGQRALIDIYPVMAIPLATVYAWTAERKAVVKFILVIFIVASAVLGAFYNVQYYYGAIHWDSMSNKAYFNSFGRVHPTSDFKYLLVHPDYDRALKGQSESFSKVTRKENIETIIQRIKADKNWFSLIEKKAKKKHITVDSMLKIDALYILNSKK